MQSLVSKRYHVVAGSSTAIEAVHVESVHYLTPDTLTLNHPTNDLCNRPWVRGAGRTSPRAGGTPGSAGRGW